MVGGTDKIGTADNTLQRVERCAFQSVLVNIKPTRNIGQGEYGRFAVDYRTSGENLSVDVFR